MKSLLTVVLSLLVLSTCASPAQAQDWETQIRAANEALLNQGELDRVPEFFLPDYVSHGADRDFTGSEIIVGFVRGLREAFPDLHVEIEVLVTEGNMVTWVRTHRGTHQGDYMGVPASGREIVWRSMVVTRYEEGRIAEEWGVSDLGAQLLGQS